MLLKVAATSSPRSVVPLIGKSGLRLEGHIPLTPSVSHNAVQYHRRCCLSAPVLSAALSAPLSAPSARRRRAPLSATIAPIPAPLMHRVDYGAAHSWDIKNIWSLSKRNRSLSFFRATAKKDI